MAIIAAMTDMAQHDVSHEAAHHDRGRFFGSAKVVTGLTLFSRLLGMLRDMAILAMGATRLTDVFWTAFTIPNLSRRLFGEGALTAAFVPVFTETDRKDGVGESRKVLANVAGWLMLILMVLCVVGELAAGAWTISHRHDPEMRLLGQLIMIVLPFMVTICLLALGAGALNCKGHFVYPSFAPAMLNMFLIAAAGMLYAAGWQADWRGLFLLAGTTTLAGIIQLMGLMGLLRQFGLLVWPTLRPVLTATKRVAALTLPMMIPLGVLQFSALFERVYALAMSGGGEWHIGPWIIAKPLSEGVVTRLYAANRLFQFPLGILAISLATVVFPLLSRHAADNDLPELRKTTNLALRLSLFMGIPSGIALIILARPAVGLIFERGQFTSQAADRTAWILQMYCLGLWAWFCNHILLRAFFALKATREPLQVACVLVGVNILLVVGVIFTPLAEAGIGLVASITAALNTITLALLLRRRVGGGFGSRQIAASLGRTLVASAVMAGAMLAWRFLMTDRLPLGTGGLLINVLGAVGIGSIAFVLASGIMASEELPILLRSFRRRRRGVRTEDES